MGRKKKYKIKVSKGTGNQPEVDKTSRGAGKWLTTGIVVVAVVAGLYFGITGIEGLTGSFSSMEIERVGFPSQKVYEKVEVSFTDFVGSESCASCHKDEYDKWKSSTHGKAGGEPGEVTIIGKFDGVERRFEDAVVRPYVDENGDYMFSLKVNGLKDHTFKVKAVVGGGHMVGGGTQTFFTEFPDGTTRFLPFDFHKGEGVWFGETSSEGWMPISSDREIDKGTEYLPSRSLGLQLSNKSCQECHGSQIQLEYNREEQLYQTSYKSLSINCESCHGAGKKHIELVSSKGWENLEDIGMNSLASLDKDASLNICFRCHALKDPLRNEFNAGGYLPGNDLEDYYALKFPIYTSSPYHPDGRVREFAYQQNHLSSDCYVNGSMTCVDCHSPHSQGYRDINGVELMDRFDDGQCTSCHSSKAEDPTLHTFHLPESEGSKCVSCHMPYLQHQGIGNALKFARSDHVIPIPRPSYDQSIGIENACTKCHEDKSVDWLQTKVDEWYGEIKPHNSSIAGVDEYIRGMDMLEASRLLLQGDENHTMAQMEGLTRFSRDYLYPDMPELPEEIITELMEKTRSRDIDIRSLALASLHMAQDNNPEVHNYLATYLEELPASQEYKIRARWAHAMPYFSVRYEQTGQLELAVNLNLKALEIQPENTAIMVNLARIYSSMQEIDLAIKYYSDALKLDDSDEIAWLNLGILFEQRRDNRALTFYQNAVQANPWNYHVHFTLGKYYNTLGDFDKAIESLSKAIEIDSRQAVTYFHLATAYLQKNDLTRALEHARYGARLNPNDAGGKNLLQRLEQAAGTLNP